MDLIKEYNHEAKEDFYVLLIDKLKENIDIFNEYRIENIVIKSNVDSSDEKNIDLRLLVKYKFLKKLSIASLYHISLEGLEKLTTLEMLHLYPLSGQKVDFSSLKNIKNLFIKYTKNIIGLENLTMLERITIHDATSQILDDFISLKKLKRLELVRPKFENTKFLSKLKNLKCLFLYQVATKSQIDIKDITNSKDSLIHLKLQLCRNIVGFDSIKDLKQLIRLQIIDSTPLPSANFVNELPKLTTLTVIRKSYFEDGNLDDLKKIEYVTIDNKKHYSLKKKDLENENFPPPIECCQ
ncbi:hypothetical protein KMW28_09370 [Flammeovirga yaeyamensis]|uniref:Uncharacterized protein n=1 Tax=Flammeovirga yaeyamensis TaxID=367791 RepID=A0AAX1N9D9_9BACT|nr:hypothetical protein [Flammeovirga yaeyamensis]MBB3698831.1 hypothetical protein [Flammeovirga yaeyamensis]NMF37416.1 hypothetical protein [Flammeovirga yaeyamensis]QWG03771.1 hypothetical protein KMW28_09370 [Flammeovirga yaeyamensis]